MARQRQQPPDQGDDEIDLQELLEEVRGIRSERDELRSALEELRKASTPAARQRAERDVRSAESGLAKALRDAGYHDVTEADLEDLRRSRRRAEFEDWYEERRAAERDADDGDDGGKKKPPAKRGAKKPADDDDGDAGSGGGRRGYFG